MAGAELLPGMETAMDARIVARLIAEEGMTPKADLPRFMSRFEEYDPLPQVYKEKYLH